MTLPDRKYSSGKGYRFGFQGQETDDEVNGDGNSIYFKYRVHDPRIGRFASIDPLSPKYPWNSPYAFSENRVIDGVELEGLEYITFHINVDENGTPVFDYYDDHRNMTFKELWKAHGIAAIGFYGRKAQSYEKRGRGALFVYHYADGRDDDYEMQWEQKSIKKKLERHGLFYGSGAITNLGPLFGDPKDYNFNRLFIIDEVDSYAFDHDLSHHQYTLEGTYRGYLEDVRPLNDEGGDVDFVKSLKKYMVRAYFGDNLIERGKDKITGRYISKESLTAAERAVGLFSVMNEYKRWKIGRIQKINGFETREETMEKIRANPSLMDEVELDDWNNVAGKLFLKGAQKKEE